jgi:hypothetical protein
MIPVLEKYALNYRSFCEALIEFIPNYMATISTGTLSDISSSDDDVQNKYKENARAVQILGMCFVEACRIKKNQCATQIHMQIQYQLSIFNQLLKKYLDGDIVDEDVHGIQLRSKYVSAILSYYYSKYALITRGMRQFPVEFDMNPVLELASRINELLDTVFLLG